MTIASIVEGEGEVAAVPVLLRRLGLERTLPVVVEAPEPVRVQRSKVVKAGELERAVELATYDLGGEPGGVLVLLDAEDDCPADLGPSLLERARIARPDVPARVVLARYEYEAWFLAAAPSLAGRRRLRAHVEAPENPEAVRGAKEWLRRHGSYRETLDQAALTAVMSLEQAAAAPSFQKLKRDFDSLLEEIGARRRV